MPANPRENADKGFWDGGTRGHGTARESGGRTSGYPGRRTPTREGVRLDLDELFEDGVSGSRPSRDDR